ncbi:hypothetical protein ACKVEX_04890, partial [Rhodocyclaceae bacterium SMB388]
HHSLLAIPRSDLAPWIWPEVRKGRNAGPYRSEGYARTNQAVGLQHWVAKEMIVCVAFALRFIGAGMFIGEPPAFDAIVDRLRALKAAINGCGNG